jgi:riboflavin synthase
VKLDEMILENEAEEEEDQEVLAFPRFTKHRSEVVKNE